MANFTTTGSDTFPAGHVLQTIWHDTTGQHSRTGGNDSGTGFGSLSTAFKKGITPQETDSDILITISLTAGSSSVGGSHLFVKLNDNTNSAALPSMGGQAHFGNYLTYNNNTTYGHVTINGSFLYVNPTIASPTPNEIVIECLVSHHGGGTWYLNRRGADTTYGAHLSTMILQEIAG